MNEKEEKAFREVYSFYRKWRETIIETDEQWLAFGEEIGRLAVLLDSDHCALALRLIDAVISTFSDLYRDGRKPMPENYFGRDDLST